MNISDLLVATGEGRSVHHECRECGKNLGPATDRCPSCGGGVSRYDID